MSTSTLQDLLGKLAHNEIHTLAELATEMGVDQALLSQMLADLERVGYVSLLTAPACDGHCQHCDSARSCGLAPIGRIWTLTAKGRRAAQASAS
jgi:predicted transcriptional regulator